ncbi:type VII secretion protein EccB [Nocardia sp. NPDC057353]|uniref:type VII secretion protein EccB n=1 Tax=Nocardia sp. NPDC057353 TaxID=3346104 RepID=UPI00363F3D00
MPAQLTTRAQVNGYRFLLRRLDHALVRRDVRMLHDPMRSQIRSLLVGLVLGILIVAGAAILGLIRPQGAIGDALIVSGKQSGALYVVVGAEDGSKTLHPVLNLASARLITGSTAEPKSVKDSKLNDLPRGPLLGIPGAPAVLPGSGQGDRSEWTTCETISLSAGGSAASAAGGKTTVLAGRPELGDRARALSPSEALLVRHSGKTFLLYDGKRAELDPGNSVLARALDLSGSTPRPAGPGLLAATTPVPPLTPPQIPQAGAPGPGPLARYQVGSIVAVPDAPTDGTDRYLVLAGGLQPVSPFTAQLIRFADSYGLSDIPALAPDLLDEVPVVRALPLDHFPKEKPTVVRAEDAPVSCVSWAKDPGVAPAEGTGDAPSERATVVLLAGTRVPIPENAHPVELATGDGTGERVDEVYLAPGTGEYVQMTGLEPGHPRRGSLFYVTDAGLRHGVPNAEVAGVLGLSSQPRLAPWAIVGQLVPGPTLDPRDAMVARDQLPQEPTG